MYATGCPRVADEAARSTLRHPVVERRAFWNRQQHLGTRRVVFLAVALHQGLTEQLGRAAVGDQHLRKHRGALCGAHQGRTVALLERTLHTIRHADVGGTAFDVGCFLRIEHTVLEPDGPVGPANHAPAAGGIHGDMSRERAVLYRGVGLAAGVHITHETAERGVALHLLTGIEHAVGVAVDNRRRFVAVDDGGDACSELMVAVDGARHVQVADGGTVQADERSAVVVDEFETVVASAAAVVGQRVAVAVEGAAEGLHLAAQAVAFKVEVGGQTEKLTFMALLVS